MLIVANWKMNGKLADVQPYVAALSDYDAVICPPAPLLTAFISLSVASPLSIGAQDCHAEQAGPFTGDTSAALLKDIGCQYVIVGHSERRENHHETDEHVFKKLVAAHTVTLAPILCIGEKQGEEFESVIGRQIVDLVNYKADSLIIAYEPVWAIGTGVTPTTDDIEKRHKYIKALVEKINPSLSVRVIYGGSVKPENAGIFAKIPDVDGFLIGGASLQAESFKAILDAAR